MITVRRSEDRGRGGTSWLDSRHTFSFAEYHAPAHMGFRALRVINEDRVAPSSGFGAHPHRDMEILSYVVDGALGHRDSLGNGSAIRPGDLQRMTAGTGVVHSEWNHSATDPVHFLQIWILPERRGLTPGYEQRSFDPAALRDRLAAVASRDGRDGSVTVHQDLTLFASKLSSGRSVSHELAPGRSAWVQVVRGAVTLDGVTLRAGDGAAIDAGTDRPGAPRDLALTAAEDAELLLFDLA